MIFRRIAPRMLLLVLLGGITGAGTPAAAQGRKLIVGTKVAVPFAMKDGRGAWRGISIELWHKLATDLNLEYEFREYDLPGLLRAVQEDSVDVAVSALSVTAEREQVMDFTHPYFNSGLGIAVMPSRQAKWERVLAQFVSWKILAVVSALVIGTIVVGLLMWLIERRRNATQFGGSWKVGLGSGLWWSAVTMTTVGYGDKTPITFTGRVVALLWMFTAIIIIALFTANVTATLTVSELESAINGPGDLHRARVATVSGSSSESYLQMQHIPYHAYTSVREALNAMMKGSIDAVVYDTPMLRYLANGEMKDTIYVLPIIFEREYYAIALPVRSPLRKALNGALLNEVRQKSWADLLYQYLGE